MGSLNDIFTINISTQSAAAKMPGFGVPCIIGSSQRFSDVIREYASTDAMLADGFLATDPEVVAAAALISANPRINKFKVARRALPATQAVTIIPTPLNSRLYRVLLDGQKAEFTSDATATVAEITAGLKSAIDALAPTAWAIDHSYSVGAKVANGAKIYKCTTAGTSAHTGGPTGILGDITDNTCHWAYVGCVPTTTDNGAAGLVVAAPASSLFFACEVDDDPATVGHDGLSVEWTHADPGIATDLAAIKAAINDWYCFLLTSAGTAEVKAAAGWAESNSKIYVQASPETAIVNVALSSATDVATYLKGRSEFRTAILFHARHSEFADAAWMGARLTFDAGSETWKFVTLAGISSDRLTDTRLSNALAKNANVYSDYGGGSITVEGKDAAGEFIDVIRGRDWQQADMQVELYNAVVAATQTTGKLPFTDQGIGTLEGCIRASLQRGVKRKFLAEGSVNVTVPKVDDISTADRAARKVTGIAWSAKLASAVHQGVVSGVVTI
jgi:hypothetical protein